MNVYASYILELYERIRPSLVEPSSIPWDKIESMARESVGPRPITHLGVFGSRSCGMASSTSDWDIVVTGVHGLGSKVTTVTLGGMSADVVVYPTPFIPIGSRLAGHLHDYSVWKNNHQPHNQWTHDHFTPTTDLLTRLKVENPEEWYVRSYRELLCDILERGGRGGPPRRILDTMWMQSGTPNKARSWALEQYSAHRVGIFRDLGIRAKSDCSYGPHAELMASPIFMCSGCGRIIVRPGTATHDENGNQRPQRDSVWRCDNFCSEPCREFIESGKTLANTVYHRLENRLGHYLPEADQDPTTDHEVFVPVHQDISDFDVSDWGLLSDRV